jgi:ABC-type oligopeptide transport system substrate-binding subunit
MGKGSTARPYSVDADTFESNWDKIFKKKTNSPDVSPHAYEYELNKSTGNVEKRFKDGTSKPNESQFDGN